MRRSLFHISYLGAILSLTTPIMAATPALDTNANIIGTINKLNPVYTLSPTDAEIKQIYSPITAELDGAMVGTFTSTSPCYYSYNSATSILTAQSYTSGSFRTFASAALPASWTTGTQTVTFTENLRDGASSPAAPFTLVFTITATGTPSIALTNTAFAAYLAKSQINNLAAAGGTTITSMGPSLPTGWAVKAQIFDGTSTAVTLAAQNPTLDPISAIINVNITPLNSAGAIAFSAIPSNLNTYNVASAATTSFPITFTAAGRVITYNIYPGTFSRVAGASASGIFGNIINTFNNSNSVLSQTSNGYLPKLTSSITDVLSLLGSTPPANVKQGLAISAKNKIASSLFSTISFVTNLGFTQTTVGTGGKTGLIALASDDITVSGWALNGTVLTATGAIGSAPAKAFNCDFSTLASGSINTANSLLQFSSNDGNSFFYKVFVVDSGTTSPLDGTLNANITVAAEQKVNLAIQMAGLLNSVTTIPHKTLDLIVGA